MKQNRKQIITAVLTVLVTAFIFGNSLQSSVTSNSATYATINVLEPLLRLLESWFGAADWFFILRKTAHMLEFCALGAAVTCLTDTLAVRFSRPFKAHAVCYCLCIAVADEFLQSFTGRTSAVYDVLIDAVGALIGIGLVVVITWLCARVRERYKEREEHDGT